MSDKLDFSLPQRQATPPSKSGGSLALPVIILLVAAGNLWISIRSRNAPGEPNQPGALSADEQKQLALKLEKQNLRSVATGAWKEYLRLASPDKEETAKVYYRIGKLHQEAKEYAQALDSFYRSETFHRDPELEPEIGRRAQECLEAMGKFAALRYELSERVGLNQSDEATGDEIVAEIGSQKISKAELDRRIEAAIERQLSQFAAYLPEEERKKQKEALLGQFSTPAQRLQFLNQHIAEEILYRRARESNLAADPHTRELLLDSERGLLAQQVLAKALADSIKITSSDLTTYYEANKQNYVMPERAEISHILVKDEDAAKKALENIEAGKDFGELASEISLDADTAKNKGVIEGWINKGSPIPGVGGDEEARKVVFETPIGEVAKDFVVSDRGYHLIQVRRREPERTRPFDEVRNEVYSALRARKEREVQQKLLDELKERYNVVIHQSSFGQKEPNPESN